jgi:hypothetical protein
MILSFSQYKLASHAVHILQVGGSTVWLFMALTPRHSQNTSLWSLSLKNPPAFPRHTSSSS